jgi:L-ascorbate metabolism protein UlaG (beta-lactamase superfamily)
MRLKSPALAALTIVLIFTPSLHAQQTQRSLTPSSAWNDNVLIAIQKTGGDPAQPGDVKIEFYGHNAFKITSPAGLTVLIDPWRNDPTGSYPKWFQEEFAPLRVDLVLSTHAHFDHDAVERPRGLMVLDRLVGQFKLGDIEIIGLADKHKCDPASPDEPGSVSKTERLETCPPNNVMAFDNAIEIVETGGLRIAFWGDNRPVPDPSLDRYLKGVDVLVLPVEAVLTRAETDAIMRKYSPRVVVPAHYFIHGLTTTASGVESADEWVNGQEKSHADVRRLGTAELTVNATVLKDANRRVYYFGNHFEKK